MVAPPCWAAGSGPSRPAPPYGSGLSAVSPWYALNSALQLDDNGDYTVLHDTPQLAVMPIVTNSDGTTTWTIEMGTSTAHTDVLAFTPVPAAIKAKDKVVFVNNSGAPHTASFAGKQSLPASPLDPAVDAPKPGPSPQTLNATDFINTGLLPPNAPPGSGPPLAARSFTFTVPAAGQYNYVCLLHVSSGMAGVINVA